MSTVRVDPSLSGDETATLMGYLGYHRDTLRTNVDGLDAEQLQARTAAPSTMALGGLVKHLAFVEHGWTRWVFERTGRASAPFSLRWVILHLVAEHARHNGHADLLRESIDGTVGK